MIHFVFIIENYNHASTIADIENRMQVLFDNTLTVACGSSHKLYGVTKCYSFEVKPTHDDLHLKDLCSLSKEFPNTVFSIISEAHHKQEFFNGLFQSRYEKTSRRPTTLVVG